MEILVVKSIQPICALGTGGLSESLIGLTIPGEYTLEICFPGSQMRSVSGHK